MRLSQLNEGPCDVATKDDISHMTADEYAKQIVKMSIVELQNQENVLRIMKKVLEEV